MWSPKNYHDGSSGGQGLSPNQDNRRGVARSASVATAEEQEEDRKRQRTDVVVAQGHLQPMSTAFEAVPSSLTTTPISTLMGSCMAVRTAPAPMTREASLLAIHSVPVSTVATPATATTASTNWLQYANLIDQSSGPTYSSFNLASDNALLQHLERQQLFANLATAASLSSIGGSPLVLAPQALVLQQQQPPLYASPLTLDGLMLTQSPSHSALVNQYLMLHNLSQSNLHLQASAFSQGHYIVHPGSEYNGSRLHQVATMAAAPSTSPTVPAGRLGTVATTGPATQGASAPSATTTACSTVEALPQSRKATKCPVATMEEVALCASAAVNHHHHDNDDETANIQGCLPAVLYRPTDDHKLSQLQTLLRQNIEVFAATDSDMQTHIRGRNKTIRLHQVGIRCRHCTNMPLVNRHTGSTYFPTSVWGFYQASQNMLNMHFGGKAVAVNGSSGSGTASSFPKTHLCCAAMPVHIQAQFVHLVHSKHASAASGAGRPYWAETALQLGLVDTEEGIYFCRDVPSNARLSADTVANENGSTSSPGVYRKWHRNAAK